MESRTFTGKTVDEATEIALRTLGAKLEDVDITVVSPGRSGILGLGGSPAVIEVRLVRPSSPNIPPPRIIPADQAERRERRERQPAPERPAAEKPSQPSTTEAPSEAAGERRYDRRGRRGGRGRWREQGEGAQAAPVSEAGPAGIAARTSEGEEGEERRGGLSLPTVEPPAAEPQSEEEIAAEQDYPEAPPAERDAEAEEMVARLLDYLLASMGVVAETFVRDELENGSLVFEIEGADAGLLIGRRGETLAALQFVVRMIVNRQLGRKAYVIIDVENYRERRADMLRRLARRTAGRVASTGRASSLEPMSPAERRIIHLALADHLRVRTESEGEGNRRRVVVLPKRGEGMGDRGPRAGDQAGGPGGGPDRGGYQDRGGRRGWGDRRGGAGWRRRRWGEREGQAPPGGDAGVSGDAPPGAPRQEPPAGDTGERQQTSSEDRP
jgi:spoIIIJ-associated protein